MRCSTATTLSCSANFLTATLTLSMLTRRSGTGRDWGEFDDRWQDGLAGYVEWMRPRLAELGRVLSPTGSLYLHCDPTASHHLRFELDGVLGAECWQNEIAWKRTSGRSYGDRWGRVHDTLLYYRRVGGVWNQQTAEHTPEYLASHYRDEDGRGPFREHDLTAGEMFRPNPLTAPGGSGGGSGQPWRGVEPPAGRHWDTHPRKVRIRGGLRPM